MIMARTVRKAGVKEVPLSDDGQDTSEAVRRVHR